MSLTAAAAAALLVTVTPDPGSSAADAVVRAGAAVARAGGDGRAVLPLAPGTYEVVVEKPGFAPARARVVLRANGGTLRVALHLAPVSALRTIGATGAGGRGAFNAGPSPLTVVVREAYRDQSQPGTAEVLAQKPAVALDRAARGAAGRDAPPVALVRGGTPPETQTLIEGMRVVPATTRALGLAAIPSFVTTELEIVPSAAAALPSIDGAVNGTVNVRFAEPTPAWRALPETSVDSRGGSFSDVTGGGASGDRRVAFALAAAANGARGDTPATAAIQRAALGRVRASLSPASGLTVTSYGEGASDALGSERFGFAAAEFRSDGARASLVARAWHVDAVRDAAAAGDPLERSSFDTLGGASLEVDRTLGTALVAFGATQTTDTGSARGAVAVDGSERVATAFARAIVRAGSRWQLQAAGYALAVDDAANGTRFAAHGLAGRVALAYRAGDILSLRASSGSGFTPPSLVGLASLGRAAAIETATTDDVGFDARVIDARTTLSVDAFTTRGGNRLVETVAGWQNVGPFVRRGAEISLVRFIPAGFGYLLQAWTASDTPDVAQTIGDVASGATHGYGEVSYHWANGSRIALGATYDGADVALGRGAAIPLNANLELQVGARGKVQLGLDNVQNIPLAAGTSRLRNAFAAEPRTLRIVVRRSIGRT
ncbi:MAG: TonB-dependent receptor, partial [Candidatus Eremiobacteraeota bacterium]|nr:TonB-dependent receptor [Candidatus Eremiobacteraeota bacterium]